MATRRKSDGIIERLVGAIQEERGSMLDARRQGVPNRSTAGPANLPGLRRSSGQQPIPIRAQPHTGSRIDIYHLQASAARSHAGRLSPAAAGPPLPAPPSLLGPLPPPPWLRLGGSAARSGVGAPPPPEEDGTPPKLRVGVCAVRPEEDDASRTATERARRGQRARFPSCACAMGFAWFSARLGKPVALKAACSVTCRSHSAASAAVHSPGRRGAAALWGCEWLRWPPLQLATPPAEFQARRVMWMAFAEQRTASRLGLQRAKEAGEAFATLAGSAATHLSC
jgi:hypothetical protein